MNPKAKDLNNLENNNCSRKVQAKTQVTWISLGELTEELALVEWTTDLETTAQIYYGTSKDKLNLKTKLDTRFLSSHKQYLNNLKAGTRYYYQVVGKTKAGYELVNRMISFITPQQSTTKEVAKVKAAGKSFDLATCPFFLASRIFLGVAFSVFSAMLVWTILFIKKA